MNVNWKQTATTWVSMAVLAGGLLSACLLVFVYKVDNEFQAANASLETDDLTTILEKRGY